MALDINNIKQASPKASQVATEQYVDTSIAAIDVTQDISANNDTFAQSQGFASYNDMATKYTALKKTIINGGYINTGLVNANSIVVNSLSADRLVAGTNSSTVWTGGGLVSQNFNGNVHGAIGSPTQGFRLSSNAAGTSADPNIYGAYIKGATLEGTSLTVNDVKVKAVGYSNNFGPLTLNKNYGFVQGDSLSNPPLYSDTFISRQEGIGYSSLRLCATTSTIEVYGTAEIKGGNNYYVTATIQKSINGGSWTNVATSSSNVKAGIISATIIHDTSSSIRIRLVPWVQYSSDANDWILQLKISINNYE